MKEKEEDMIVNQDFEVSYSFRSGYYKVTEHLASGNQVEYRFRNKALLMEFVKIISGDLEVGDVRIEP